MTNFDKLKAMTVDEFAEWLDKHGEFDNLPWSRWWDSHYCKNCESIKLKTKIGDTEHISEASYCEVNDKCRFFPDQAEIPDCKQMVQTWLEAEAEKPE